MDHDPLRGTVWWIDRFLVTERLVEVSGEAGDHLATDWALVLGRLSVGPVVAMCGTECQPVVLATAAQRLCRRCLWWG